MVALDFEKRIIKEAEHQLSSMAEAIATTLGKRNLGRCIEIINNTRAGIVIFFRSKKGNALFGGKFKSRIL